MRTVRKYKARKDQDSPAHVSEGGYFIQTTIQLDPYIYERAKKRAKKKNISLGAELRNIIMRGLNLNTKAKFRFGTKEHKEHQSKASKARWEKKKRNDNIP